jgi:hypothetical protein
MNFHHRRHREHRENARSNIRNKNLKDRISLFCILLLDLYPLCVLLDSVVKNLFFLDPEGERGYTFFQKAGVRRHAENRRHPDPGDRRKE